MNTGTELIAEISNSKPGRGGLYFWWLGQQSWAIRTASHVLYLDPYLTPKERRNTPPLFAPEEMTNADFVLGTHDHTDHIDRPSLGAMAAASPVARFIMPAKAATTLPQDGLPEERLIPMDDGKIFNNEGLRITAIKAQHEAFDYAEGTGYPYLQYIIEVDGATIYHAGDTLLYEGMRKRLSEWQPTVAFIPINGRDAERYRRGCMGNLTWQEAADLAGGLRPRLTCPAHYEMFSNNAQDPQPFADYMAAKYPDLPVWIGEAGCRVEVKAES